MCSSRSCRSSPSRSGRERDPRARGRPTAQTVAERVERETGYKAVAWQEAHEDLLSAFVIRNIIMYTVVGAILLVASFGTYNIISTITHEKTRDIAILKSLGLSEATVRRIFVLEDADRARRRAVRLAAGASADAHARHRSSSRSAALPMTRLPLAYSLAHYLIAGAVALASSLVGGFFPARKAASAHPVDIIRGAT